MTRIQASAIHLLISAAIVGVIFLIIFFVWYPGATFTIAGALSIVFLLISVDLVLGPLLTLIVYKKDKPSLWFDLSFIATIQVIALLFGSFTLYKERPYYMVFAVDRFNLVTEKQIDRSKLRFDELLQKPFADVISVYARMPEGDAFQQFLQSVVLEGQADLDGRPEFWEPYSHGKQTVIDAIRPLAELNPRSAEDEHRVQRAIRNHGTDHPNLGFLPIATLREDMGMVMDMDTAELLDVIKVDPW